MNVSTLCGWWPSYSCPVMQDCIINYNYIIVKIGYSPGKWFCKTFWCMQMMKLCLSLLSKWQFWYIPSEEKKIVCSIGAEHILPNVVCGSLLVSFCCRHNLDTVNSDWEQNFQPRWTQSRCRSGVRGIMLRKPVLVMNLITYVIMLLSGSSSLWCRIFLICLRWGNRYSLKYQYL